MTRQNEIPIVEYQWYYEKSGKRVWGISEKEIAALINLGTLSHGTSVWKKQFKDWMKIENTELKIYLDEISPPPLASEHISNTIVWILAFAPFLGLLLEYFVAGVVYAENPIMAETATASSEFWYVTILLNISLSILDEKRLKNAGINTANFKGLTWLVPVYLYKRAKSLKQGLGYFVVWLTWFVLVVLQAQ